MIYGAILAGGIGTRMGAEKPKQYIHIAEKPIIIHTLEKFIMNPEIDYTVVLCPKQWVEYTKDLCKKYLSSTEKVSVIEGGETRNDTIMNAIDFIETSFQVDDESILITHDAVRPFVTYRIIHDNIVAVKEQGACDTVFPATDTIVESKDSEFISSIPDRSVLYQGQTPQSFRLLELKETFESLTDDEKKVLTDAAKIYVLKDKKVALVEGESFNIKVTYPYDLEVAETLMKGGK